MPRLPLLEFSPSRLAALCPEIVLEIMRLCSPADLRALRSVSRLFCLILTLHPSCWKYARESICIPPPPPFSPGWPAFSKAPLTFPAHQAQGIVEAAYATYLFGGGSCTVCGTWSWELPHSFSLGFRCCSKNCRHLVFQLNEKQLVSIDNRDRVEYPGIDWVPHQPKRYGGIYFHADIAAAKEIACYLRVATTRLELDYIRRFRADQAFEETVNIENLQRWKPHYINAVAQTKLRNTAFLKTIAKGARLKVHALLESPTLLRVFTAFNRDLALMDVMAWRVISTTVQRELATMAIIAPKTKKPPMPSVLLDPHGGLPFLGKLSCAKCGSDSTRRFSSVGLKNHQLSVHSKRSRNGRRERVPV